MSVWIPVLLAAATAAGGVVTLYPEWQAPPLGLLIVAASTFALGVYFERSRSRSVVWRLNWRPGAFDHRWPVVRLLPLRECAQIAYEKTRGYRVRQVAERESGPEGVLSWYANGLVTGQEPAPLFGHAPASLRHEVIPKDQPARLSFIDGLEGMKAYGQPFPEYEDLRMASVDLARQIRVLRTW